MAAAQKTIKQSFGSSIRRWDPAKHPAQAELVDLAVPALQEAFRAFNHATFLTNRLVEGALTWRHNRGQALPPLTQLLFQHAFQSVTRAAQVHSWDPANPAHNPVFAEFYQEEWLPHVQDGDVVVRSRIRPMLDEWARLQPALCANRLIYNNGIPLCMAAYFRGVLLEAILAADPQAIQDSLKPSKVERFAAQVAAASTTLAREEGESSAAFQQRVIDAAWRKRPRNVDPNIYRQPLRDAIGFVAGLFGDLLPLEGGKPRSEEMVERYLAPLLELRARIPNVEGARSFALLPQPRLEARFMQVSFTGLKSIVAAKLAELGLRLEDFKRRAGARQQSDDKFLWSTIILPPEKSYTGYKLHYFIDLSLSSICHHFGRDDQRRFQRLHAKEASKEWMRDEGTTGAPAPEGATGRAKRVDDRGIPNSVSVTGKEHRHLLCTRQVSKDKAALMKKRPDVLEMLGGLRSALVTDLPSCLAAMDGWRQMWRAAGEFFCIRKFTDAQFLGFIRRQRAADLKVTKYLTGIPTHVRDPAARVLVTDTGHWLNPRFIIQDTLVTIGDARFRPGLGTVEGIQRAIVTRGGPSQYAEEFRTSMCCSNPGCQAKLKHTHVRLSEQQRAKLGLGPHAKAQQYQLLRCPKCGTWWQRDTNGGSNLKQVGDARLAALMDPSSDHRGRLSRTYEFTPRGTEPQPPKRHYRRRRGRGQQQRQQQGQQQH